MNGATSAASVTNDKNCLHDPVCRPDRSGGTCPFNGQVSQLLGT